MMKYSMIAINYKYNQQNNPIVRRVLISYIDKKIKTSYEKYIGTKLIYKDKYFTDKCRSHRYIFQDDGYSPVKGELTEQSDSYKEYYKKWNTDISHDSLFEQAIEFEAATDEEAIRIFNERNELRD